LGVPWEYESKDFNLEALGRYLPDFRLPWQGIWVEVKGDLPSAKERSKAQAVANQSGQTAVIFQGSEFEPTGYDPAAPAGKELRGSVYWIFPPGEEEKSIEDSQYLSKNSVMAAITHWYECPICSGVYLGTRHDSHRCGAEIRKAVFSTLESLKTIKGPLGHLIDLLGHDDNEALDPTPNTPRILEAYEKARLARFEYGESGPPR